MKNNSSIYFTESPRTEIEVELPDGRLIRGPRGSQIADILGSIPEWGGSKIVGAVVEGNLRELSFALERDAFIKPLNLSTSDGSKIYRRSLTFLLETAFEQLYENSFIAIDHSVPSGGYFCKVLGRPPLSSEEIKGLQRKMEELVKEEPSNSKGKSQSQNSVKVF